MNASQSPPLSIRHFFYLTFGIAVALWLHTRGIRVNPTTVAAVAILAARIVGAFVQGSAIAMFLWLTARWLTRRPVKLQDPGAIYALVLSLNQFLALVGGILVFLFLILENRGSRWMQQLLIPSMLAGASLIAFTYIYGAIRVREWSWKILFVCVFLMSALSILQIGHFFLLGSNFESPKNIAFALLCARVVLQTITVCAVFTSLGLDWRHKTERHWLHYFGIGLLALTLIQFLLQLSF